MSDKIILSQRLNEQLNGFRKSMDKFAESCIKIVEKYGLSSDETECEQPDADTISRQDAIEHLKKRLYESALNNDGIASKIFEEIADNRVQIWVDELPPSPTVTADTDTVSRQDAIDAIKKACNGCDDDDYGVVLCNAVVKVIKALPPSPIRPKGKWIATTSLQEGQITWKDYKCSNCSHHREKPMNFCEVCGAKMER